MATIIILGAGIRCMSRACELRQQLGEEHRILVINDSDHFEFTPSNPWVAVGWRTRQQITVELPPLLAQHGIDFIGQAATRVLPDRNEVELAGDMRVAYDYLVIATGPKLALEEVPGLGPAGYTDSICRTDHAAIAGKSSSSLCRTRLTPISTRSVCAWRCRP